MNIEGIASIGAVVGPGGVAPAQAPAAWPQAQSGVDHELPAVLVPRPVAEKIVSASTGWVDVVMLARWPRLWQDFPPAAWAALYSNLREKGRSVLTSATSTEQCEVWQKAAANIRAWAPHVVNQVPDAERLCTRARLEDLVVMLDGCAAATAQLQQRRSTAERGRWTCSELVAFFEASLHLRNMDSLQVCAQLLGKAAAAAAVGRGCAERLELAPSGSTMRRLFLSMDVALMMWERQRHEPNCVRYVWCDSSPQGGRDWFLTQVTIVSNQSDLIDLRDAADYLVETAERPTAPSTRRARGGSDSSSDGDDGSRLQQRVSAVERLRAGLREHVCPPVALGLRQSNVSHKASGLVHALSLECPAGISSLQGLLSSIASVTTDMGTEMGLANFRARSFSDFVPAWQRQGCQDLQEDDQASRVMPPAELEVAADTLGGQAFEGDVQPVPRPKRRSRVAAALEPDVDGASLMEDEGVLGGRLGSVALRVAHATSCARAAVRVGSSCARPDCHLRGGGVAVGRSTPERARLTQAVVVPGMLHIVNNALSDVDIGMSCWATYWPQLLNVAGLLTDGPRLQRVIATCLVGDFARYRQMFEEGGKVPAPYTKRWGSVCIFARDALPYLEVLREAWRLAAYGAGGSQAEASHWAFDASLLTSTLASPFFFAYTTMVCILHGIGMSLEGWSEGCPCHPRGGGELDIGGVAPAAPSLSRRRKRQDKSRLSKLGGRLACPMQGRRAPEVAMDELRGWLEEAANQRYSHLLLRYHSQLSQVERQQLAADFAQGKAHLLTVLGAKLEAWGQLPLALCGLAHHLPAKREEAAKKVLDLFARSPVELRDTHHPRTLEFLGARGWRSEVEAIAEGRPLSSMPFQMQVDVAKLKFIPIVERSMEAKHKDVKRVLQTLTRHDAPRVSMAIRSRELQVALGNPTSLNAMVSHLASVRGPRAALETLGLMGHPLARWLSEAEAAGHWTHHQARGRWSRAARLIYRCDIESQFQDLSAQQEFNSRCGREDSAAADLFLSRLFGRRPIVTIDAVVGRALADHLRALAVERPHAVYTLTAGDSGGVAPLALELAHGVVDPASPDARALPGGPFSVLATKDLKRLRVAPACAAVTASTGAQQRGGASGASIIVLSHASFTADSGDGQDSVFASMAGGDSPVRILSGFEGCAWNRLRGALLVWERAPETVCALRGFRGDLSEISRLLEKMLAHDAIENTVGVGARGFFASSSVAERGLLEELETSGLVTRGAGQGGEHEYVLSRAAACRVTYASRLRNGNLVMEPQHARAVADWPAVHLLVALLDSGWRWRQASRKIQAAHPPYRLGEERVLFTAGLVVECPNYLRVLVQAEQILAVGGPVTEIPHGAAVEAYEAILAGEAPPPAAPAPARLLVDDDGLLVPRYHGSGAGHGGGKRGSGGGGRRASAAAADVEVGEPEAGDDDCDASVVEALAEELLGPSHVVDAASAEALVLVAPPAALEPPRAPAEVNTAATAAAQRDIAILAGRRVGPFRFTAKQSVSVRGTSGGKYGGWEAECPFHRKNATSGCRKWFGVRGPTLLDRSMAANAAMLWCSVARDFPRQCWHLAYAPDQASAPPAATTRALPIFHEGPPATRAMTDVELDAEDGQLPRTRARAGARTKTAKGRAAQGKAKAKADARSAASGGVAPPESGGVAPAEASSSSSSSSSGGSSTTSSSSSTRSD